MMKSVRFPLLLLAAAVLLGAWAEARDPAAGGAMPAKHTITPFLWFDDDAEDAIRFYASIFPGTEVLSETRMGPKGALLSARFRLGGHEYIALNGGPMYSFTEAFSLFVSCGSQEEVDDLWAKLTAGGGEPGRCGWLKDRFGLSWQVIPTALTEMMQDKDPARARRVVDAMLKMGKIDIAGLRRAYDGR
jgi:predicted 3-demethylubiquinone-9 3-methyltransferase (glyoxalase superfamily)